MVERKWHIDVARGIALILMVVGHLGLQNSTVQAIYSFHMPLFFVISGMTVRTNKNEPFKLFVLKRFRNLMIPYFLFALIYSAGTLKDFVFVLYGSRAGLVRASSLTPLWFLPCLFIADILFQVLLQGTKKLSGGGTRKQSLILCASCILISMVGVFLGRNRDFLRLNWPLGIDIAFVSIIFLWLGFFIENNLISIIHKFPKWSRLFFSVLLMTLTFFISLNNLPESVTAGFNHVEMSIGSYGKLYLFALTALLGSSSMIILATTIQSKFIQRLGKSTLICLGTHSMIITSVYYLTNKVPIINNVRWVVALAAVIVFTIPLNWIVINVCPNIVGKRE